MALGLARPIILPFAALCLAHSWAIPELYAARGARAVKPAQRPRPSPNGLLSGCSATSLTTVRASSMRAPD